MVSRPRSDLNINLPALRKLDNMLLVSWLFPCSSCALNADICGVTIHSLFYSSQTEVCRIFVFFEMDEVLGIVDGRGDHVTKCLSAVIILVSWLDLLRLWTARTSQVL